MSDSFEKDPQDLLSEIMDRAPQPDTYTEPSSAGSGASTEAAAGQTATVTAPEKKAKRTTPVYIYLLILFAAAFAMLLLAYLVQLRDSKDSALASSLSIGNLTQENQTLRDEITALEAENAELQDAVDNWERIYHTLEGEHSQLSESNEQLTQKYAEAQAELSSWSQFWTLEQSYQAEDYESCAALFLLQTQSEYGYVTPKGAEERQLEILETVIDQGLLDEDYYLHPEDYNELIVSYFAASPRYEFIVGVATAEDE